MYLSRRYRYYFPFSLALLLFGIGPQRITTISFNMFF